MFSQVTIRTSDSCCKPNNRLSPRPPETVWYKPYIQMVGLFDIYTTFLSNLHDRPLVVLGLKKKNRTQKLRTLPEDFVQTWQNRLDEIPIIRYCLPSGKDTVCY